MLDPNTEHATQLLDHWYWRPGHRPGRPFYTWHLTFEGQPVLHQLVIEYQGALRRFRTLDAVPVPWIHVTMHGVGFVDEVPARDLDALTTAVGRELADLRPPTVRFHHAAARPEAIVLYPYPALDVQTIRGAVRHAITTTLGRERVTEPDTGYQPHLTVAYVNRSGPSAAILDALTRVDPKPAYISIRAVSLIALERDVRGYRWQTIGVASLG